MPAGRGEDGGLPHLAAELVTQAVAAGELRQAQRRDEAAALGEPEVEQVAPAAGQRALGIDHAAQRLVEHHRGVDFLAQAGQAGIHCVRQRLFDRTDAERLEFPHLRPGVLRGPGLVDINADVPAFAQAAADLAQAVDIVVSLDADLHLHVRRAEDLPAPGGHAEFHPAPGRGDHAAVANFRPELVKLGREAPGDVAQRLAEQPAMGVEQGQLHRAPGGVAGDSPVVARLARGTEPLDHFQGLGEIATGVELAFQVALEKNVETGRGRLPGDILPGNPLAPADGPVSERDAHEDVVGLGPRVGGVRDASFEWNANDVRNQFTDVHPAVLRRLAGS